MKQLITRCKKDVKGGAWETAFVYSDTFISQKRKLEGIQTDSMKGKAYNAHKRNIQTSRQM